jgi:hypothetical protein
VPPISLLGVLMRHFRIASGSEFAVNMPRHETRKPVLRRRRSAEFGTTLRRVCNANFSRSPALGKYQLPVWDATEYIQPFPESRKASVLDPTKAWIWRLCCKVHWWTCKSPTNGVEWDEMTGKWECQ